MSRGRPLELAIGRAASAYRIKGDCVLTRQWPPVSTGPDGLLINSGKAPLDFIGVKRGGQALAIEAKSTEAASWPIALLREDQRDAMATWAELGADVRLVVSFDRVAETYSIPWSTLGPFLENPWRESLSVTWARAFGLVVPEQHRKDTTRRKTLFLDAVEHAGAAQARLACIEERETALARPARPEASQEALELPPKPSVYVGMTPEQRAERIRTRVERVTNEDFRVFVRRVVPVRLRWSRGGDRDLGGRSRRGPSES